jgi:hypothetical protein
MADLNDVVDECLVVSTAFSDISSDTYEELGAVNFEDNDKLYPFFCFNKTNISATIDKYSKNTNLASQVTYTCQLHFLNTYTELEKATATATTSSSSSSSTSSTSSTTTATVTLQTKQGVLMAIANKYFAELRTRNNSGDNGFILGDVSFNAFDETHNERLVEVSYNVQFITYIEDCSLGTFNY